MRSNLAKVLHQLDGSPLINHVSKAAASLDPRKIYVVIGHQGEEVEKVVLSELGDELVEFPVQKEQLGTGDAVNSARGFLENEDSILLVLSGDVPMIESATLEKLVNQHKTENAGCTILTVELDDPTGYGRVVRDSKREFHKIVEQKDANEDELKVCEINSGIYCFNTKKLYEMLSNVSNDNAQGEYYLTDVPKLMKQTGDFISLYKHNNRNEIEGINNRKQLAEMEKNLRKSVIEKTLLESGATLIDPNNVYISKSAEIERDTVIYPNVSIEGKTEIGEGCVIRSGTRIADSKIGKNVVILDNCVITNAKVENDCNVGPFAHLRPDAQMKEGARVGNFVEMKKTTLGRNSKANHLTYLGDANIGENSNIGAGTITCNYDGVNKHSTEIGNDVKIGSDTMLVAPVKVHDGAVTGAGSVVTKDISKNSLALGTPAKVVKNLAENKD